MSSTQHQTRVATPGDATLTLMTLLLAIFVIPTSISGTAVALPSLALQLHPELAPLQWVVTAFNLTFACFTLAWGALADIIGRKRAFGTGAVLYVVASLLSATANDILVLDAARALAGIGAASIFSAGSALLATTFVDDAARMRVFALAGAAVGIGVGVGPSLSGALVESLGWHSIFFAHAAIMALVVIFIPKIRDRAPLPKGVKIDVGGIGLFVTFSLLLIVGIVQGPQWGWTSAGVLGLFAAAAIAFLAFVAIERRVQQPMLNLDILRNRQFLGWSLATVAPSFGFFTLLTYLPSYLTSIAGYSASATGAAMLLLAVPLFVCPIVAGKLVQRVEAKSVLFVSLGFLIAGDLLTHIVNPGVSLWYFAAPMLLVGIGTGLGAGLVDGRALGNVDPAQSGLAAGFLNTLRLGSETVAIALYGALLATQLHAVVAPKLQSFATAAPLGAIVNDVASGNLASPLAAVAPQEAAAFKAFMTASYDTAFHWVMTILTGICLVLSALIVTLLRGRSCPRTAASDALSASSK